MPDTEVLSQKDIEEYHKSGGEVVPETKAEVKPPLEIPSFIEKKDKVEEKTEEKAVEVKKGEGDKSEKKPKKDDDPHAENHRKALQEARLELRELKKQTALQLRERDQRHAQLSAKLESFLQAANPPPTRDKDPLGYLEGEIGQIRNENKELKAFKESQETAQRTSAQQQHAISTVIAAAAPFIEKTKDYSEAYSYVLDLKREEMLIAGVPEAQLKNNLGHWEMSFAAGALRSGKSPSEQLYALAQRLGYKQKSSKPSEAEAKLKSVKEGQEAAKTVTTGGMDTELSLSALEQMSDEQIRQLAKDPKKWSKLVGGNA